MRVFPRRISTLAIRDQNHYYRYTVSKPFDFGALAESPIEVVPYATKTIDAKRIGAQVIVNPEYYYRNGELSLLGANIMHTIAKVTTQAESLLIKDDLVADTGGLDVQIHVRVTGKAWPRVPGINALTPEQEIESDDRERRIEDQKIWEAIQQSRVDIPQAKPVRKRVPADCDTCRNSGEVWSCWNTDGCYESMCDQIPCPDCKPYATDLTDQDINRTVSHLLDLKEKSFTEYAAECMKVTRREGPYDWMTPRSADVAVSLAIGDGITPLTLSRLDKRWGKEP